MCLCFSKRLLITFLSDGRWHTRCALVTGVQTLALPICWCEAAALPLQVGPASHQPPRLLVEMRQFDLQPPLIGRGPFPENLQDQSAPVDDLALGGLIHIALLHGAQSVADAALFGLSHPPLARALVHLPPAGQRHGLS